MAICPDCHSENPDDAAFCARCGTQLAAAPPRERIPAGVPQSVTGNAKRNNLAITSLVLGTVGLVLWLWSPGVFGLGRMGVRFIIIPVSAVTGLALGILSLKSQKQGIAIAGICICGLGILVLATYFIIAIIFWSQI